MPLRVAIRPVQSSSARIIAAALLAVSASLLTIAARLTPDPSGIGTHRQLPAGIGAAWYSRPPPCSMILILKIPCPTCGMTTAFAHFARGQIVDAIRVQPAGALLALSTLLVALLSGFTLFSGRLVHMTGVQIRPLWIALACVAIILLAWGYKIAIMR